MASFDVLRGIFKSDELGKSGGGDKKSRACKETSLRKQANVNREVLEAFSAVLGPCGTYLYSMVVQVYALTGGVPPLVTTISTANKRREAQQRVICSLSARTE